MSKDFEGKLRGALEKKEQANLVEKAEILELEQLIKEKENRLTERFDALEKVFEETLKPLLQVVNNVVVGGEGKIEIENPSDSYYDRLSREREEDKTARLMRTDVVFKKDHEVSIVLKWQEHFHIKDQPPFAGQALIVSLSESRKVKIRGANRDISPEIDISLSEEDWQEQFAVGVSEIIGTKNATHWLVPSGPEPTD